MKKCKKIDKQNKFVAANPVAKYAHRFNTATIFRDKTKYSRKSKHKNTDCFPIATAITIGKQSVLCPYSA